jgi:hypothetical protein
MYLVNREGTAVARTGKERKRGRNPEEGGTGAAGSLARSVRHTAHGRGNSARIWTVRTVYGPTESEDPVKPSIYCNSLLPLLRYSIQIHNFFTMLLHILAVMELIYIFKVEPIKNMQEFQDSLYKLRDT